MGLAAIDSYSQKEHTEIHKIPKFGVNQASFHCPFENVKIYKEMYGIRTLSDMASGCHTFLCKL